MGRKAYSCAGERITAVVFLSMVCDTTEVQFGFRAPITGVPTLTLFGNWVVVKKRGMLNLSGEVTWANEEVRSRIERKLRRNCCRGENKGYWGKNGYWGYSGFFIAFDTLQRPRHNLFNSVSFHLSSTERDGGWSKEHRGGQGG